MAATAATCSSMIEAAGRRPCPRSRGHREPRGPARSAGAPLSSGPRARTSGSRLPRTTTAGTTPGSTSSMRCSQPRRRVAMTRDGQPATVGQVLEPDRRPPRPHPGRGRSNWRGERRFGGIEGGADEDKAEHAVRVVGRSCATTWLRATCRRAPRDRSRRGRAARAAPGQDPATSSGGDVVDVQPKPVRSGAARDGAREALQRGLPRVTGEHVAVHEHDRRRLEGAAPSSGRRSDWTEPSPIGHVAAHDAAAGGG